MRKRSFAGNSVLNFLGQVVVMVIAFVTIPLIVRGLGSEQFGLLTLLWVFVGYFNVFDLGIGQAAVKFVSERIGSGDRQGAARILRTVLTMSGTIGVIGFGAALFFSFVGIERLLNISPELSEDANTALRMLAIGIPASLLSASLRSVPVAFGRFDIVNGFQILGGILQWVGSAAVLALGGGFLGVIGLTLGSRYLVLACYGYVLLRFVPDIGASGSRSEVKPVALLKYGGWVSVSQVAAPLLSLLERLFVGAVLSVAWLTYYSVPSDAVLRLLIVPMSLVTTLFPLMSGEWRLDDESRNRLRLLYSRSLKLVVLMLFPIVITVAAFSGEILLIWLGKDFEQKSSLVLSILAAGTLLNAVAQLPQSTLQAIGRPDLPAKLVLVQIPVYAGLVAGLTAVAGIVGTALAWVIRVVVETTLLLYLARQIMKGGVSSGAATLWRRALFVIVGCAPFFIGAKLFGDTPGVAPVLLAAAGVLYTVLVWKFLLLEGERSLLRRVIGTRLVFGGQEGVKS